MRAGLVTAPLTHLGEDDWRLVHGEVDCYDPDSDSPRMGHAWLESRDEVFDPVVNQHFSKDKFYGLGPITVTGRYTKIEACNLMLDNDHYGPWD